MDRDMLAALRALEKPGPPRSPGTWEIEAPAPCQPAATNNAAVGGYYPERSSGPAPGVTDWDAWRDGSGIVAQIVADRMLITLAFLR